MGVYKILEYRQKDGQDILKVIMSPTKQFPKGAYFYCDAEDIDLVERGGWVLNYGRGSTFYISCPAQGNTGLSRFHQFVMLKHTDEDLQVIDHINHCGFDNCSINLRNVSSQVNLMNVQSCGYASANYKILNSRRYNKIPQVIIHSEIDACKIVCELDKKYCSYYDFYNDFSNDIDILNMERTGKISHEAAIHHKLSRYIGNIWYWFRYDFFSYFKERGMDVYVQVPGYDLDDKGRLIEPYSRRLLNPYYKQLRVLNHGMDYLWFLMDDLLQEEGIGLAGTPELGDTFFIDFNAKSQSVALGNPKVDAKIALIRELLSKQTKL